MPEQFDEAMLADDHFVQLMHLILVKRQITEGQLQCPHCERVYEIKNGIPNMLLNEDEV